MRFYDAGQTSSFNLSPMAFMRSDRDQGRGRRVAENFNLDYSDREHYARDTRFTRGALSDMIERRIEEEDRIFEEFADSEFYEDVLANRSWVSILRKVEDFRDIAEPMHLPILWYKPVREAVIAGRMEGFEGLDASLLPDEDPYERLIENGRGEIYADGSYDLSWEFTTDDPRLTVQELDVIEEMRRVIREELIPSKIDPTNSRNQMD